MFPSEQEPLPAQEQLPLSDTIEISDKELVLRYQAGDRDALGALLTRHVQSVYHFIIHYSHYYGDVDDIVADVFEKACKNLNTLKNGETFRGWLFRIARNLMIDRTRRAQRICWLPWKKTEIADDREEAWEEDGKQFEQEIAENDFIVRVLAYASRKYRIYLYLDIFEEVKQREIATALGVSESKAKLYIARGKEELRARYPELVEKQGALERRKK